MYSHLGREREREREQNYIVIIIIKYFASTKSRRQNESL